MKKKADVFTVILRCFVLAVFLGVSVFVFLLYRDDLNEAENYRENGGQTTAIVTKARNYVEYETTRSGRSMRATTTAENYSDITIKYTVDGEEYSSRITHKRGTYKKGDTLTVYYLNPDPGGELRFRLEPPLILYIVLGSLPVLAGGIWLTATFVQDKRSEQRQKTTTLRRTL